MDVHVHESRVVTRVAGLGALCIPTELPLSEQGGTGRYTYY